MAVLAMLVSGGRMVQTGALTAGDLTAYLLYTGYVGGSVAGTALRVRRSPTPLLKMGRVGGRHTQASVPSIPS
jgi:hypothetical protein